MGRDGASGDGASGLGHEAATARFVADLDRRLQAAGTPSRAAHERQYLHSELHHYGTSVPDNRAAVRAVLRAQPGLDRRLLNDVVARLWAEPTGAPVHERRLAAALLMAQRSELLELRDAPRWERLIRQARTWALVDVLAGDAIGPALAPMGEAATPVLDRWAQDGDFWLRRAALLVHLRPLRAGAGDWNRFARYADALLEEREFFVRKAIGWVLRDTSRRRPGLVLEWLAPRADRASGVTWREAVKYLDPDAVALFVRSARHRPGRE